MKSIKHLIIISLFAILGLSCEKDSSGSGNYIIGVSNSTNKNIQMEVILDGASQGVFIVKATQQGNYSSLCNDLVYAARLDNVRILNYVSSGSHTLKLRDFDSKHVYIEKNFEMKADDCISQQFNL
jgi:hypothetical protein